ncbi:MAG: YceI family protein [Myxococcales bacterium]
MKTSSFTIAAFLLLACVAQSEESSVSGPVQLGLAPGASLRIEGTSTLHKWSAAAQEVRAVFGLKPGAAPGDLGALGRSGAVASLELSVPIRSLKSGESGLDDNMYKALRVDEAPAIVFRMASYQVGPTGAGGSFTATLKGQLRIAGAAREVEVAVDARPVPNGLRITGSKVLSMKDFGVKAPVLMLGMLRTGDAVTVRFDLEVVAGAGAKG